MKKTVLLVCLSFFLGFIGRSMTYTSINDGEWNNTVYVWSTNGSTPCNCTPGLTVNTDTIVVQNNVLLSGNLTLQAGAVLEILSGASLMNPAMGITVKNGKLISNGLVSVSRLTILKFGIAEFFSSVLEIKTQMDVDGIFLSNFSNIFVTLGNIEIGSTGNLTLENNSKISFSSGNFNNYGSVQLDQGCCIQLGTGNFKNFVGGVFSGSGTAITDNGNITNEGLWQPTLLWCAAGSSFGMSSPENCTTAYLECNEAPLAAELLSYNVQSDGEYNLISWYTYSEENGDFYKLERSSNGINWDLLSKIEITSRAQDISNYLYIDEEPLSGISYYKLTLINIDGIEVFSAILGIESANREQVTVFPNPTNDNITVRFNDQIMNAKISIVDGSGQVKEILERDEFLEETFILPYPCGLYFIYITSDSFEKVIKVIKR